MLDAGGSARHARRTIGAIVFLALAAALPAPAASAEDAGEARLRAVPISTSIGVDGFLDEPAWAAAPVASGFRQRDPGDGDPATERTEVRVLYDGDTLYVGIAARDREPGKVIG